ncbi:MAG TPA: hypothetical protein V6D50_03830 [Chroococcales cyanobacterium]
MTFVIGDCLSIAQSEASQWVENRHCPIAFCNAAEIILHKTQNVRDIGLVNRQP